MAKGTEKVQLQVPDQFNQIHTLMVQPGIKRDGTQFESNEYTDGVWCRFQRGRPRKIGGYRQIFSDPESTARGMIVSPQNGVNYIFTGYSNGLHAYTTGTNIAAGAGPFDVKINKGYSGQTLDSLGSDSFTVTTDKTALFPIGTLIVFEQTPDAEVYTVLGSTFASGVTTVDFTPPIPSGFSSTTVYLSNISYQPNDNNLWQFDIQYSPMGGRLNLLANGGRNLQNIDNGAVTPVLVGGLTPDENNQWSMSILADSEGQNPTYKPIVIDGGVCCLYPFIFVYGSNGFIANNNVAEDYNQQSPNDWNGPLANQVNMSASKIVKGLPMRGGTNSPSGLFWATDSLIRVSFTGQAPNYWSYDIVSSQISIMSSNSVVEMGGTYFWLGVDRFYFYNGSVNVLPNDKNVNWLFDNINYTQRQKVWATKVPRYNEIWFFYPRGTATECTDAIIYNVKDKIWYDAGSAAGAQRSCGWTTEILPFPLWYDWNFKATFSYPFKVIDTPGGAPAATGSQFYLAGNQTQQFAPGSFVTTSTKIVDNFIKSYEVASAEFTASPSGGFTLVSLKEPINPPALPGSTVFDMIGGHHIYQHEFGYDEITNTGALAVYSSVTTSDIGWVGGRPDADSNVSVNRRMHLRRMEPDFVQTGQMEVNIIGRKFPDSKDPQVSGPYYYDPGTGKIDFRLEYRLLQIQFVSNTQGGNFELGRVLLTVEYGDERP